MQGFDRVISGLLCSKPCLRTDPGGGIWFEKAWNAASDGGGIGGKGGYEWVGVCSRKKGVLGDARPKFLKLREALARNVAGDETSVDRADRSSDDPVGLDIRLMQRLINASLIGAKRSTALKHQNNLSELFAIDFDPHRCPFRL